MFINRQKQSEQETTPLADSVDPVRVAAATREGWSGGAPLRWGVGAVDNIDAGSGENS